MAEDEGNARAAREVSRFARKSPDRQQLIEMSGVVDAVAIALKKVHAFKAEMDEEARRHMFRHLATQAS